MPHLFGTEFSAEELRRMTGTMSQIAGVRLSELADGKARGMRVAEVYTGSGFRFQVLLDRAMDIGAAEFAGKPLAWLHPALGGPDQYEPHGYGWARTFGGGLMTTCGLTFFGHPEEDAGEHLGLHGRISHIPASNVRVTEQWQGDDYVLAIEGDMRQSVLGAENLLLTRKISTRLGATGLLIEDRVRNDGYRRTPHMMLYHCNFGFPVVSPASVLLIDTEFVKPRDEAAQRGVHTFDTFDQPMPDYAEQVFFHKPRANSQGFAQTAIVNRALHFGAYIHYRAAELPSMAQWKMMAAGDYVCALEPANQWETSRKRLRDEGRLCYLDAGQAMEYQLEIGVLPDDHAVAHMEAMTRTASNTTGRLLLTTSNLEIE